MSDDSSSDLDVPLAHLARERAIVKKRPVEQQQQEQEQEQEKDSVLKKSKQSAAKQEECAKLKLSLGRAVSLRDYQMCHVTDAAGVKSMIEEHGVAIVPGVLSAQECDQMRQGFREYFLRLTQPWQVPFDLDNPQSWRGFYNLLPMHSMLLQHWGIGHAQFVWNIRQNPAVVDIFARLWQVRAQDLLVSFDGASLHLPPETTGRGYYRGNDWLHTDQRLSDSRFHCVQSWVTANDVNDGDATLCVLEGSHKYHGEFAQRFRKEAKDTKPDWYKLANRAELDFFVVEKQCRPVFVKCPAGSLVLWDSRTFHCGREPFKDRPTSNIRMVVYLCYTPRAQATSANLTKKTKLFNDLRMTTHWPHKPKVFPLGPRTYGADLPRLNTAQFPPVLTDLGRCLAGFN